jgi:hypothetical protein
VIVAKKPNTHYTPEDVERGLFALAITGSPTVASRQLAAKGLRVDRRTLSDWKVRHAERFREIANRHTQEIREVIAQEQIEIAQAAGEAEREAIAKARGQLKDGSIKDASIAARNFSVSKGIALDKHLTLRGEPTVVHEHRRQAHEIIADLQKKFPGVIEGHAEEVRRVPELPDGQ